MATINQVLHRFRRYIGQVVALPVIVLVLCALLLVWQITNLLAAAKAVDTSDKTITQENYVLKLLIDEETGQRGYLIGGKKLFLQPFNRASVKIEPQLDKLTSMVANDSTQVKHVEVVRTLHSEWLQNARIEIQLREQDPSSKKFRDFFNKAYGKVLMDQMRDEIGQMQRISENRRDTHSAAVERQSTLTIESVIGGAIFFGIFLGLSTLVQIRRLSKEYELVLRSEQKNSELLSTTLLSIGDAVLVTDKNAVVTQMNAVAEELTGWNANDAIGRPASTIFNIFNESTRARVESPIDRVIREGVIVGLANHTVLVHRDGRDIPIDDSGAPIRDGENNLIGTVLVFRDITERKALETKLEELYRKEHQIAESLQRSLLTKPSPYAFKNMEIEAFYRPAWNEAQVGGDFFDLYPIDGNKVAIVVGDVSGKGLDAAEKTAEIKFTLRAYLREHPHASSAMVRLNEFLYETQLLAETTDHYFLCLSISIIDTDTGNFTICTAGMEAPLIIRHGSGEVEEVVSECNGMLLGVSSKIEYQIAKYKLLSGDILALTTDGITEARLPGGEEFGISGLANVIKAFENNKPLSEIGDSIIDQASQFAGGSLSDDACVLLARRL